MTKIKLCGLRRSCDVDYVNKLLPDFIGFVFAPKSSRYVTFDEAQALREKLDNRIIPVGVFVNEAPENIKYLVNSNIIGAVQLHGSEDNEYIKKLRDDVHCPIIQAFKIESEKDIKKAEESDADYIMLDSGGGTGETFNHSLISDIKRDFFLAGGLGSRNVREAISLCRPYAVDASSSLETDGFKDEHKMTDFVQAVRNVNNPLA
ncbi:MAG: phosphoribosylanthranilate isomerase [Oscillospiraceae bacterium]|nr:phosphoribosylanthranilate isomerase [Oscillospiraceae bacterium]